MKQELALHVSADGNVAAIVNTLSAGTSVWDVATGERLLHDASLRPLRYHRGARHFLTALPDGAFQISRLIGQA